MAYSMQIANRLLGAFAGVHMSCNRDRASGGGALLHLRASPEADGIVHTRFATIESLTVEGVKLHFVRDDGRLRLQLRARCCCIDVVRARLAADAGPRSGAKRWLMWALQNLVLLIVAWLLSWVIIAIDGLVVTAANDDNGGSVAEAATAPAPAAAELSLRGVRIAFTTNLRTLHTAVSADSVKVCEQGRVDAPLLSLQPDALEVALRPNASRFSPAPLSASCDVDIVRGEVLRTSIRLGSVTGRCSIAHMRYLQLLLQPLHSDNDGAGTACSCMHSVKLASVNLSLSHGKQRLEVSFGDAEIHWRRRSDGSNEVAMSSGVAALVWRRPVFLAQGRTNQLIRLLQLEGLSCRTDQSGIDASVHSARVQLPDERELQVWSDQAAEPTITATIAAELRRSVSADDAGTPSTLSAVHVSCSISEAAILIGERNHPLLDALCADVRLGCNAGNARIDTAVDRGRALLRADEAGSSPMVLLCTFGGANVSTSAADGLDSLSDVSICTTSFSIGEVLHSPAQSEGSSRDLLLRPFLSLLPREGRRFQVSLGLPRPLMTFHQLLVHKPWTWEWFGRLQHWRQVTLEAYSRALLAAMLGDAQIAPAEVSATAAAAPMGLRLYNCELLLPTKRTPHTDENNRRSCIHVERLAAMPTSAGWIVLLQGVDLQLKPESSNNTATASARIDNIALRLHQEPESLRIATMGTLQLKLGQLAQTYQATADLADALQQRLREEDPKGAQPGATGQPEQRPAQTPSRVPLSAALTIENYFAQPPARPVGSARRTNDDTPSADTFSHRYVVVKPETADEFELLQPAETGRADKIDQSVPPSPLSDPLPLVTLELQSAVRELRDAAVAALEGSEAITQDRLKTLGELIDRCTTAPNTPLLTQQTHTDGCAANSTLSVGLLCEAASVELEVGQGAVTLALEQLAAAYLQQGPGERISDPRALQFSIQRVAVIENIANGVSDGSRGSADQEPCVAVSVCSGADRPAAELVLFSQVFTAIAGNDALQGQHAGIPLDPYGLDVRWSVAAAVRPVRLRLRGRVVDLLSRALREPPADLTPTQDRTRVDLPLVSSCWIHATEVLIDVDAESPAAGGAQSSVVSDSSSRIAVDLVSMRSLRIQLPFGFISGAGDIEDTLRAVAALYSDKLGQRDLLTSVSTSMLPPMLRKQLERLPQALQLLARARRATSSQIVHHFIIYSEKVRTMVAEYGPQ